jgi:excisionase family DNA binding protein
MRNRFLGVGLKGGDTMKNWLSIKETANEVGVSVSTIRRWLNNGLAKRKIGRTIKIHIVELNAYMDKFKYSSNLPVDKAVDSFLNPR